MDSGLALACIQVLTRLCSVQVGARTFLEYQPRLFLDASGASLKAPTESNAGGLLLLLRLARPAFFPGLLQMLADLALLLLEEGPTLQQRMETEILNLFSPQNRVLPAKEISRQLFSLMGRNPELFEEALKAVTQRTSGSSAEQLLLEPIPESNRPQRPKSRGSVSNVASSLSMLQTLVFEACFSLEIQHHTSFPKIHEAALKEPDEGEEPLKPNQLPPSFPVAVGPDSLLYILDFLLTRIPGLSGLLLRAPMALPATPTSMPGLAPEEVLLVDSQAVSVQKSMLLVMTRHLLPRFARLAELWSAQAEILRPSQKILIQQAGTAGVQRCLPHLSACLCSAARHAGEPRRVLVVEAIVALQALAEGPKQSSGSTDRGSYGAQVAAVAALAARLLSAAAAAERKEEGSGEGTGGQQTPRQEDRQP